MSLWSFIEERCKAKGIKPFDLVDEGISSASLYRLQDGGTPGERIKNKLSAALGCSIEEINEVISQTDQTTPFGETVKKLRKKNPWWRRSISWRRWLARSRMLLRIQLMRNQQKYLRKNRRRILIPWCWLWKNTRNNGGTKLLNNQLTEADLTTTVEEFWREIGKEFAKEVL